MVYDSARALAKEIQESDEYRAYEAVREKTMESETTRGLIKEYHRLQLRAQAKVVSGEKDEALMQKLQKLGELLQLDADASAFLIAEYRINKMLSDVYKILADVVGVDLTALGD